MATVIPLLANTKSPALLPQAPPGTVPAFYAHPGRTAVLPVATGQSSAATAGTAIALYGIARNISVLR